MKTKELMEIEASIGRTPTRADCIKYDQIKKLYNRGQLLDTHKRLGNKILKLLSSNNTEFYEDLLVLVELTEFTKERYIKRLEEIKRRNKNETKKARQKKR